MENTQAQESELKIGIKGSLPVWGMWERLVPKQIASDPGSQKILESHYFRYETATQYSQGKQVLDIACGTGYGSKMLRDSGAMSVVGVDVSAEAVQYAKQNYQVPGVEFVCADAETFKWSSQFDVAVSFETLEHLPHPDKFLERLYDLLKPKGTLLLSVPLGETRHIDPYHLHAFNQEDIFNLLKQLGFVVRWHRCANFLLTNLDLIRWRNLYPESQPTILELLFSNRGRQLMCNFISRGGLVIPELLVAAYPTLD